MKRILVFTVLMLSLAVCVFLFAKDNKKNASSISETAFNEDIKTIEICRQGIQTIVSQLKHKTDSLEMINRDDKNTVVQLWKEMLDHYYAMDTVLEKHRHFYKKKNPERSASFHLYYLTFLTEYRYALDFIHCVEHIDNIDVVLNEAFPDYGFPSGLYGKFKFRFLNIAIANEFIASTAVSKTFPPSKSEFITAAAQEDSAVITKFGMGKGEILTVKNGIDILKKAGQNMWLPVQKEVSAWMGNTKVKRKGEYLIPETMVKKAMKQMEPGDILLERREWYMTNVGIPGFWTHAALYIGTPEERNRYFSDKECIKWLSEKRVDSFESLLKQAYTDRYSEAMISIKDHHPARVIEAIADGVVFTSFEYSAHCDSLAVLRPSLSKREKAEAVFRAFNHAGKPYDYAFDFLTDNALVCTELVFKCYEPESGFSGIHMPLKTIMGKDIIPANAFAEQYDILSETESSPFSLVLFIDGYEKEHTAVFKNEIPFRASWKRPKWHILTQQPLEESKKNKTK